MEDNELDEFRKAYEYQKQIDAFEAERQMKENIRYMKESFLIQSKKYNVSELLYYEKLICDFLADKFYYSTTTKKDLLANLSKAGNNLDDEEATEILPSKLTHSDEKYFFEKKNSKPRQDKREEIDEFINRINYDELGIQPNTGERANKIQFMDILIFSLLYIFDSGREYKKHSKNGEEYYKT